jgi:hypothetical protein
VPQFLRLVKALIALDGVARRAGPSNLRVE